MKVTLLGFTVPDEMMDRINESDRLMQTQTHRFAWSLVGGLRANEVEVRLLSAAPVSDYPGHPRVLWRSGRFEVDGVRGRLMPFVNLIVAKHLTRYAACWRVGMRELRGFRPDWILIHGVHSPFLWFGVQVGRRVGAHVAVVLTDPPGVVRAEDARLRRSLKRLDIAMVTRALRRSDAVIVLAEPLAADFAPSRPHLVVEGLVSPRLAPAGLRRQISPTIGPRAARVVYAGGLHEEYGVRHLVDAVRDLPGEVELHLFGRGSLERWLEEVATADSRVERPRLVDAHELPEIYASSDVLVQPRPIDQGFVKYSFPSKLIEYMASGTPVVSTRLPSIPEDYEPYVVWADGDTSSDIGAAVGRVLSWSADERRDFGVRASRFIRDTRNVEQQGSRIVGFLRSVDDGLRGG